jgi:hypothetical protein
MKTMDHHNRKPIGLTQVFLQMAANAIAFMIVLGMMALVMPLWQLGKQLISYGRYHRIKHGGDVRTIQLQEIHGKNAYYRFLRHLLTEGIQGSFKELHERPTPRISELIRQLDQTMPGPMSASGH